MVLRLFVEINVQHQHYGVSVPSDDILELVPRHGQQVSDWWDHCNYSLIPAAAAAAERATNKQKQKTHVKSSRCQANKRKQNNHNSKHALLSVSSHYKKRLSSILVEIFDNRNFILVKRWHFL